MQTQQLDYMDHLYFELYKLYTIKVYKLPTLYGIIKIKKKTK